jgi:hypothetical protein
VGGERGVGAGRAREALRSRLEDLSVDERGQRVHLGLAGPERSRFVYAEGGGDEDA